MASQLPKTTDLKKKITNTHTQTINPQSSPKFQYINGYDNFVDRINAIETCIPAA